MKKVCKFLCIFLVSIFFALWVNADENLLNTASDGTSVDTTTGDETSVDSNDLENNTDDTDLNNSNNTDNNLNEWPKLRQKEMRKRMELKKENMEKNRELKREEFQKLKGEKRDFMLENKKIQKQNLRDYKQKNAGKIKESMGSLSDEVKEKLESINETFRSDNKLLLEELKNTENNEEKEEIKEKLKTLRETHYNDVHSILPSDSETFGILKERKEVYKNNKLIRWKMSDKRKEFREKRGELITSNKQKIINILWNNIEKVKAKPVEKLEKINSKIGGIIESFSSNTWLSETKKDSILSQLEALGDIIKDILNTNEEEEELNIEELLEIE